MADSAPNSVEPRRQTAVRRDVLILTPSYVVPGIATLVSVPVLFHLLGGAGYGLFVLIFAVANGVPLLTGSWLEELTLRYGHRTEAAIGNRHLALSIALSIAVGGALAALLIPDATATVALVSAVSAGAVSAYLVTVARLQSALRFGLVSLVAAGRATLGTLVAILIAATTADPVGSAVGLTIGFIATAALGLTRAGPVVGPGAAREQAKPQPLLGYGLSSSVGAAALYVVSVGDRFVLSSSRSLEEVGRYAAIYAVVDLGFRLVPSVLSSAIRPRLFRAWDAGDHIRGSRLVAAYAGLLGWLLGVAVVGVIAVGPAFPTVRLELVIAGPIALGLQMFVLAHALGMLLSADLRQARLAAHIILAAVANIALNVLLVPAFGVVAAALVTAISFSIYLLANAIALRRDGLLPDVNASRLTAVSIAGPAVGVVIAVAGQPAVGTVVAVAILLAALPLVRAVLAASPELIGVLRPPR